MKILLSPAKTLDYKTPIPVVQKSLPFFEKQADEINRVLRVKSPKKLMELMHISEKLATLNWERNQNWETTTELRQALYALKGEVYLGLDAYTIPEKKLKYTQNTLRILSGQYGVLKPLDAIKPYRLEMGTNLKIKNAKNLYEFWGKSITKKLNEELENGETVINLASNEYFKVIDPKLMSIKITTPIFKDFKNGQYKVISFFAKKARGLMSRFAIENEIENEEHLKKFSIDGYAYDENLSSETQWVFTR